MNILKMEILKKIFKISGIILLVIVGLFLFFVVLLKTKIISFVPKKIPYTENENRFIDSLENTGLYDRVWREPLDESKRSKYKKEYELNLLTYDFLILDQRPAELRNEALLLSKKLYQEVNRKDTTYFMWYTIVFRRKGELKFTFKIKDLEK